MRVLSSYLENGKVVISDGAWGTRLQQRGLGIGECPEMWNITHRRDVFYVAKEYIDAGSDMILTNSFGGSPIKLSHFGLQDKVKEVNKIAAEISREAAGDNHIVAGSIGPTGVILMMGEVSEEEVYEGFCIQAEALRSGGVDAFCIETMSAIDEALLAIRAVKEVTDIKDIICTFTFEKTTAGEYKTMMGISPSEMTIMLKEAGATIIGSNCGNGIEGMIDIVKEIRSIDRKIPVLIHANAGKPIVKDGKTVFPESPEVLASKSLELIKCGVNIIGGCCGTGPEHIKALVETLAEYR